jgi:predicted dehydrogenase
MTAGVAVVGAGYWGPNLVRNFQASQSWDLRWICDLDREQAARTVRHLPGVHVTDDLSAVLDDDDVVAVAIATPAATHADLAVSCLEAGRHVLIEKPLASSVAEGRRVLDAAEKRDLVVMADHTFCYTSAVQKLRELVHSGSVGTVQYVDSVRANLGLIQRDIDVVWDLAPHDLSILDFVLPVGSRPSSVAAVGADPLGAARLCVAYLTLRLPGDGIAHLHVNWLSPSKIRTMIVGGSERMVVWDDVNPAQRLSIFDRGIELHADADVETRRRSLVSYRSGDMVAPALPEVEALSRVVEELAAAIAERRAPMTDGRAGLRVLEVLEAADRSIAAGGVAIELPS